MFRELEKSFPSDECFLDGRKSKTSRPPLAGQQDLRFVHRIGPIEKKKVSIKSIIFLSIKKIKSSFQVLKDKFFIKSFFLKLKSTSDLSLNIF